MEENLSGNFRRMGFQPLPQKEITCVLLWLLLSHSPLAD